MKIVILKEFYLENKYKPMCGTCKYRGNVRIAWDPTKPKNTQITGITCDHPQAIDKSVEFEDICDEFYPVNDTLKRIFLTKRLL